MSKFRVRFGLRFDRFDRLRRFVGERFLRVVSLFLELGLEGALWGFDFGISGSSRPLRMIVSTRMCVYMSNLFFLVEYLDSSLPCFSLLTY